MKTPMWTKSWLTMAHLIKQKRKLKDDAAIGHFRVPKTLTSKCGQMHSLEQMSFICMRIKNHFHIKGAEQLTSFWYRGPGDSEMAYHCEP